MNEDKFVSKNSSIRRTYHRRNRKGNRTNFKTSYFYPITTTTILIKNNSLLINATSVPINDLLGWISSLTQHKYILGIVLSLFILLTIISIIFLIILKCSKRKSFKTRRQERIDKERLKNLPDFLDDHHHHNNKDETEILLEPRLETNSSIHNTITTNGILPNDNISNTLSLDPVLVQKIEQNNPPNSLALSPMADDTSLDTLRGSLISSPSRQNSTIQSISTPIHLIPITTTDSLPPSISQDERAVAAEKDDDFDDLVLKPRYVKATNNNSTSNLSSHRQSASSIEQSIRKQEERAEKEERSKLYGSNSNIYEKELRKQAEQEASARKQHTTSQVSLVSRTSEDSCY